MSRQRERSRVSEQAYSFRDYVARRQQAAGSRRKGERTRDRIRLAMVELLNEMGFRDLTVAMICERAKVSPPVLYLYFPNKLALTQDVLREFLEEFMSESTGAPARTLYEAIYDANYRWIASARSNAGLVRCLLQVSDEVPEFSEVFALANDQWYRHISGAVAHRFPEAAVEEKTIRLAAYALGGMIDEITRKLFAARDAQAVQLVAEVAPTDESLAIFLTDLWYRALYGLEPPTRDGQPSLAKLRKAAQSLVLAQTRRRPSRKT